MITTDFLDNVTYLLSSYPYYRTIRNSKLKYNSVAGNKRRFPIMRQQSKKRPCIVPDLKQSITFYFYIKIVSKPSAYGLIYMSYWVMGKGCMRIKNSNMGMVAISKGIKFNSLFGYLIRYG